MRDFAGQSPYVLAPGSAQLQWLNNDLAATRRPWRIVFLHCPLFTSALHRADDFNYNGIADRLELQQWLLPVLTQYGVQVVLSGHDHCYERFAPTNGVHCFVTGGGGYSLYAMTQRDALSQRFEQRFHHIVANLRGESLNIQAVDRFGVVFDTATIPRVSPPVLRAGWVGDHTLRLYWNSAPGQRCQLETAATASGPFSDSNLAGWPVTATSYQTAFDLDLSGSAGQSGVQFFRVRVLP
jgi:hypothetical protein